MENESNLLLFRVEKGEVFISVSRWERYKQLQKVWQMTQLLLTIYISHIYVG